MTTNSRPRRPRHPAWRLRRWLKATGNSQVWLAGEIGHSTKHVNQLCRGRRLWTLETAKRLAEVTGIPVKDWMRWRFEYEAACLEYEAALEHADG